MNRAHALVAVMTVLIAGCGARGGLELEASRRGEIDGGVDEGCPLPDEVRGVVGRTDARSCGLAGRSADGRAHRVRCEIGGSTPESTFEGCTWFIDGALACECDEPDWAQSCPNGVPSCVGWNRPFDFARDVRFEP